MSYHHPDSDHSNHNVHNNNNNNDDDDTDTPFLHPRFPFWCGHYVRYNNNSGSSPNTTTTATTRTTQTTTTIHGLAIDVFGRATIGMSSLFLGPALLQLANTAAGCSPSSTTTDTDDDTVTAICTNTIYGFRPSSLLTNIAAVSGVIGCFALPFIGSVMDHTNHRRAIGAGSAYGLVTIKVMEYVGLSNTVQSMLPNIWFGIAILQIVASVTFYTHLTAAYAYLSELSSVPQEQSHYNTSLFVIMYGSTLVFMVEVLVLSSLFQSFSSNSSSSSSNSSGGDNDAADDDVGTAQIALLITILTCAACFHYSWTYYFPNTTAKKVVPLHQSVYSAGFYTLYRTLQQLLIPTNDDSGSDDRTLTAPAHHHHQMVNACDIDDDERDNGTSMISPPPPLTPVAALHPHHTHGHRPPQNNAMFYILCSVSFSEAAANAIIVISTTYMKEVLLFNANQIGIIFLIVLLSGIPGSQLGRYVTISLCSNNPIQSLMYCNLLFGTSTVLAAVILRGPQDIGWCYMFGGCWGMCLGWLQPQNTASYVPLIPRNQEAEMMGLYILACQMLSWLPPTVFTVMNELHLSMYYGVGSLTIYFLISMMCLYMVGDYQSVVNASSAFHDNDNNNHNISCHNDDIDTHTNSHPPKQFVSDTEMTLQQPCAADATSDQYYPISPASHRLTDGVSLRNLT